MRFRIAWERCPDCGRSSTVPGGCFVVQRRGWLWWYDWLTTYDRGGSQQAEHYRSVESAEKALKYSIAKKDKTFRVVREYET